jgi:hypothetical protein
LIFYGWYPGLKNEGDLERDLEGDPGYQGDLEGDLKRDPE